MFLKTYATFMWSLYVENYCPKNMPIFSARKYLHYIIHIYSIKSFTIMLFAILFASMYESVLHPSTYNFIKKICVSRYLLCLLKKTTCRSDRASGLELPNASEKRLIDLYVVRSSISFTLHCRGLRHRNRARCLDIFSAINLRT